MACVVTINQCNDARRTFVGLFKCIDDDKNIILENTQEYRKRQVSVVSGDADTDGDGDGEGHGGSRDGGGGDGGTGKAAEGMFSFDGEQDEVMRNLNVVMLPGSHIVRIDVVNETPPAEGGGDDELLVSFQTRSGLDPCSATAPWVAGTLNAHDFLRLHTEYVDSSCRRAVGLPSPSLNTVVTHCLSPVSYTHLTLPTIYSV